MSETTISSVSWTSSDQSTDYSLSCNHKVIVFTELNCEAEHVQQVTVVMKDVELFIEKVEALIEYYYKYHAIKSPQ